MKKLFMVMIAGFILCAKTLCCSVDIGIIREMIASHKECTKQDIYNDYRMIAERLLNTGLALDTIKIRLAEVRLLFIYCCFLDCAYGFESLYLKDKKQTFTDEYEILKSMISELDLPNSEKKSLALKLKEILKRFGCVRSSL
jgi:hypothetical protein